MMVEVRMPKPGNAVESCLLLAWKKEVGEAVRAGEVLCEIETDKAVMEVESPADGVLLQRLAEAGQEVPVQTPIAIVGKPGAGTPIHPCPRPPVEGSPVSPHVLGAWHLRRSSRASASAEAGRAVESSSATFAKPWSIPFHPLQGPVSLRWRPPSPGKPYPCRVCASGWLSVCCSRSSKVRSLPCKPM